MPSHNRLRTDKQWQEARQKLWEIYTGWLKETQPQLEQHTRIIASMSTNIAEMDAPIALRKGKRRNSAIYSPQKIRTEVEPTSNVATPARRRKRVRFSDSAVPSNTKTTGTGITPHLRRASLGTPRKQRSDTPGRAQDSEDLQFTPYRQVLDERVKRRIRRNGLSEEMNDYEAEKKTKAALQNEIDAKDAELKRLRAELEESRTKTAELSNSNKVLPASQERLDEVEAELEALRQSFALEESESSTSWDHIPTGLQGPSSDGGDTIRIYEDDDVGPSTNTGIDADSLAMGLELEAARQAKQSFLGSFRESTSFSNIQFADSPARRSKSAVTTSPRTPRTFYHDLSKQLKTTTNRAEEAELALKSLDNEIDSLGFSTTSTSSIEAVGVIANHFRQARLEFERIQPGESIIGFENAKFLPEVMSKLKYLMHQVRNRGAELKAARDQQHNLKGNFEKAIVAAEKANARIQDLEHAIDSSAEEMLNARVRAQRLEKDLAEKEKDVESLTTALNKYRADVSRLEQLISQLEEDHAATVRSKEEKVSDLDALVAAEQHGRRAAESSAIARLSKITELESALSQARDHAADVETTISTLQTQLSSSVSSTSHSEEIGALNTRISNLSTALASANAEVSKLKITKAKLEERVRMEVEQGARAVEAIQADLIRSVAKTNENKKNYVRGAKVRIANWEMSDDLDMMSDGPVPMTPASLVRFAEFSEEISIGGSSGSEQGGEGTEDNDDHIPGSVEIERGRGRDRRRRNSSLSVTTTTPYQSKGLGLMKMKPRRRYDSGIGMSPVSDLESQDDVSVDDGFMTPDLSSEVDCEVNNDGGIELDIKA